MLVYMDFCDLFFFILLIISFNFFILLVCWLFEEIELFYIVFYNYYFIVLYRKRVFYFVVLNLLRISDMYLKWLCILSLLGVCRNKILIFILCVLFFVNFLIFVFYYC